MIELDVEKYCENCPGFEADVERDHIEDGIGDEGYHITTITCKSKRRCAAMMRYLRKEHNKEVMSDAN